MWEADAAARVRRKADAAAGRGAGGRLNGEAKPGRRSGGVLEGGSRRSGSGREATEAANAIAGEEKAKGCGGQGGSSRGVWRRRLLSHLKSNPPDPEGLCIWFAEAHRSGQDHQTVVRDK